MANKERGTTQKGASEEALSTETSAQEAAKLMAFFITTLIQDPSFTQQCAESFFEPPKGSQTVTFHKPNGSYTVTSTTAEGGLLKTLEITLNPHEEQGYPEILSLRTHSKHDGTITNGTVSYIQQDRQNNPTVSTSNTFKAVERANTFLQNLYNQRYR